VMAMDLAADPNFNVTVADQCDEALSRLKQRVPAASAVKVDLADPHKVRRLVGEYDIVLGALSSTIGFRALRAVIEAGRNYCDISFMPENALELDDLARHEGVTAVVDNGVAPGMSNMFVGWAQTQLDEIESVAIYVGGLPRQRTWPFEYKAGFSPADVIEEYTRPSRIVEHGGVVVRQALSEPELLDFDGVGTLEAFNTDGLRSLAVIFDGPTDLSETQFEKLLWTRIQSLADKDAWLGQTYDKRVSADPKDPHFSLSFGGEAFFVIGLHPNASRPARRFAHPVLVFNLHDQFERLREHGTYDKMRETILARDKKLAGDINPMLAKFGESSEERQYSGRKVDDDWQCPFQDRRST